MIDRNQFICQLDNDKQKRIKEEVMDYYIRELHYGSVEAERYADDVLCGKIWILEEEFEYLLEELGI